MVAKDVPSFLENTNLAKIEESDRNRRKEMKDKTYSKYQGEDHLFKFSETGKGYKSLEEIKREIEEERIKETNFNASYYHPVPDFSKKSAKIRLNVSSILREDYLLRKQQEKDVSLLKNYEMELRDPTEYYIWFTC